MPPTPHEEASRTRLSYGECKTVEKLIRAKWNGQSYQPTVTDETIAQEASRCLAHPVSAANVSYVRKEAQLFESRQKVHTRFLTQPQLDRLEEVIQHEGAAVVSKTRVYSPATYLAQSTRARKVKPWLHRKAVAAAT